MEISEIAKSLTVLDVVNVLRSLGVSAKLKSNFRLRTDDKEPSASIYVENGKVKISDFGGNEFHGDLFDVLREYFNMDYRQAKEIITSYSAINTSDNNFKDKEIVTKQNEVREILRPSYIKSIFNSYQPLTKKNLPLDKIKEVITKLIPLEYVKNAKLEDKKLFFNIVKYDYKQDEPVVATFTPAGEILTIKHRRYKVYDKVIKWKSLKSSEANKYCQFRIKNNEPIFIIEGTHDYTTAILLGINFIALPNKGYKFFKSEELELLKGGKYDFILIPDLDFKSENDESYIKFKNELISRIKNFKSQLYPFINSFKVWNLKHFKDKNMNVDNIKDLSDFCSCNSYDEIINIFHNKSL